MLDNGLASLAGSLISHNIPVEILDLSTTELIKKLAPPPELNKEITSVNIKISEQMRQGKSPDPELVSKVRTLEKDFDEHYDSCLEGICNGVLENAEKKQVSWVGLKLWNGDGFTGSLRIAQALKKANPNLRIYGGGPHADWFRKDLYRYQGTEVFDAIALREAEEIIVSLALGKPLEEIPNLILKDGTLTAKRWIASLDSLPYASYDKKVYPAITDDKKIKTIVIDESRGCPYVCNFCVQPVKSGRKWRLKSPKRVVDEMEKAIEEHEITVFRYAGSSTPPSHAVDIAKEIIRRGLKVRYSSFASAKGFTQEDMHTLRESGCLSMFFGLESGDPYILKESIGKKASLDEYKKAIRYSKNAGIFTIASIIVPSPYETPESLENTFRFLCETRPDSVPISPPGMMQNTEWGNNPEKYNFKINDPDTFPLDFISYKIKLFFPGILWDPAPYSVNGLKSHELLGTMSSFGARLEQAGILTAVPDDLYVAARCAGMQPREYRDETRKILLTHDYTSMQKIVKKTNQNITGKR